MSRVWRALRVALFILIGGPLIGGLLYTLAVVTLFAVLAPGNTGPQGPVEILRITGWVLVFAYLFGGVQALFCAIVLGVLVYRQGTFSDLAAQLTVIGIHGLLGALWMIHDGTEVVSAVAFYTALSMASAWIVRRLLVWLGWLRAANPPATSAA